MPVDPARRCGLQRRIPRPRAEGEIPERGTLPRYVQFEPVRGSRRHPFRQRHERQGHLHRAWIPVGRLAYHPPGPQQISAPQSRADRERMRQRHVRLARCGAHLRHHQRLPRQRLRGIHVLERDPVRPRGERLGLEAERPDPRGFPGEDRDSYSRILCREALQPLRDSRKQAARSVRRPYGRDADDGFQESRREIRDRGGQPCECGTPSDVQTRREISGNDARAALLPDVPGEQREAKPSQRQCAACARARGRLKVPA